MTETTACFLYGADMDPQAIRRDPALTGARFVGIGSVAAADAPHLPPLEGRVHGIVLVLPGATAGDVAGDVAIRYRDGGELRGFVRTAAAETDDRAAVIAAARYWELPARWWRSLSES